MPMETPFINVPVPCPVCAVESTHRYLKLKMFKPGVVEDDQHVVDYVWENQEFAAVRPNFYHIWHCPHCHFCDEKEVFRGEDASGGRLEMLREKVLLLSRVKDTLLMRMGVGIGYPAEPDIVVEWAICAHLLAIHVQELLSPSLRMTAKIARFSLRLAWLYRERAMLAAPPPIPPKGFESHEEFLASLRSEWPKMPMDENEALDAAIIAYETDLSNRRTDDPKFEINVQNLLSVLFERKGDMAGAIRYTRAVFTGAAKTRNGAKAAAQRGGANSDKMNALANWMNLAVEKAVERSEKLQEIVFQAEFPRAREVLAAMGKISPEQAAAKLREGGFSETTIRRVTQMLEKAAKKK